MSLSDQVSPLTKASSKASASRVSRPFRLLMALARWVNRSRWSLRRCRLRRTNWEWSFKGWMSGDGERKRPVEGARTG